jgi:hypothetical protein
MPWAAGLYDITCAVCRCAADFELANGTCDSCGAVGWDTTACACNKVRAVLTHAQ